MNTTTSAPASTDSTTATQRALSTSTGEQRGRLRIDRVVLRRIAEHTADVECGAVREKRRTPGSGGRGAPRARLSGPDYALHVRIAVVLRYPDEATDRVRAVRERIIAELHKHAGATVRAVDVVVTALVPAEVAPRVR